MQHTVTRAGSPGLGIVFAICCALAATVPADAAPDAPDQALVRRIEEDVAALRGLPWKHPIRAEAQTTEQFAAYLDRQLALSVPERLALNYGRVVRRLGLYRGPEITDFREMMKFVMSSQAAAYYDPERQGFYVLMSDFPEPMLGMFFAHELMHGLQDQHFGLQRYLFAPQASRALDDDELLARQAVVEGEATLLMTAWLMQRMQGVPASREQLAVAVQAQTQFDSTTLRAALQQPEIGALAGDSMRGAVEAMARIPSFLLQTMMGAYLQGLGFVFAVQERGWAEVERLYGDAPPASSEQILHPEKWFAGEQPLRISWPEFSAEAALDGWELLEANTLGEFQWRIVFEEQGLAAEAESAAAGWDGDRYAVFSRREDGATLLLLRTAWDTPEDAGEFAAAYRRLLVLKYGGQAEPARLVQRERDVLVVEGGSPGELDALLEVVGRAGLSRRRER